MSTLVTGATGFVGSAVVRKLLEAGHDVRVLVRRNSDRRNIEKLPLAAVCGDLTDPPSLRRALAGCTALFHVAADYRLWIPDPRGMYETNVEGTLNLMRAALEGGVARVVYTSSVATMGLTKDGSAADEDTPVGLEDMIGHYKRSKFLAEELVRRCVREEGLPAVIVNPSTPVGARDIKPTPTGRMIVDAASNRMRAYVHTGLNLVHVDDVAAGHLLAHGRGRIGERYILGGSNMTLREILSAIAYITGLPPPRVRLPRSLVLPVAALAEIWARTVSGKEPMAVLDGVRMAKHCMYFSSAKAGRDLGYKPRPVDEALREAVDWFQRHGYCG